jgi:hypothetical protein
MENLIVPEFIEIQLTDFSNSPVSIENIAVYIKTKARHKNDFKLGPFFSKKNGTIQITKVDFMNEVNANYDSGLMDFSSIESNHPEVEIILYSEEELNRMIYSRTNIWSELLNGEKERWESIEILIEALKNSTNRHLELNKRIQGTPTSLNGELDEIKLKMKIKTKPNTK